jgi:sialic acid synthase SpsE
MTSNLIYAAETDDLDGCMQTMISKRIHYLPVKNENEYLKKARRYLFFQKDLSKDSTISEDDIIALRPNKGI